MSQNIQDSWNQTGIMNYDGSTDGESADGRISEDEYVQAVIELSGGKIGANVAQQWFRNMQETTGDDSKGGIDFNSLIATKTEGISLEFNSQAVRMNYAKKAGNEVNAPGAFDKIDGFGDESKADGKITKDEWDYYVQNKMPGGDLLSQEDSDNMFRMLAQTPQEGESGPPSITREEFANKKETLDIIQNHATATAKSPPTEMQKMMQVLQGLIEELANKVNSETTEEFSGY